MKKEWTGLNIKELDIQKTAGGNWNSVDESLNTRFKEGVTNS